MRTARDGLTSQDDTLEHQCGTVYHGHVTRDESLPEVERQRPDTDPTSAPAANWVPSEHGTWTRSGKRSVSELILRVSERFVTEDVSSIRGALSRHVQVGEPQFVVRLSIDPPSIIQLLGAAAAWQILLKPAAAFIKAFASTSGKKAAEALWDTTPKEKKNEAYKPVVDVATTLVEAAKQVGGDVKIGVGLDGPDEYFGTVIWTDPLDPMDVARSLSAFVIRAEKISATVRAEVERGNPAMGPFYAELEDDGTVTLRWRTAPDSKIREVHIP